MNGIASTAARLDMLLKAAGHPVDAVSVLANGTVQPGWDVTARADGLRVRLDFGASATDPQKAAARSAVLAADLTDADVQVLRASAKLLATLDAAALGKALRAEALVMMDEINLIRQWVTDFKAAVAAAATLADLKTRVAALANLPQRSAGQIIPAIGSKIDGGTSD